MIITGFSAAECRLPLPYPIKLGPVEITTRDFVVLRLETDAGPVGEAVSYPRGSALLESLRRLAPFVLGTEISMRRKTVDQALQSFVNGRPSFIKAASLVDIALWDIAAKEAGQPLYHLLGGVRSTTGMMVVAGYFFDRRSDEDVLDEVRKRVDEGYERIKIMISGTDLDRDVRIAEAATKIAGHRLAVDAHWAFRDLASAYQTCAGLDHLPISFIEDPFGPYQGELSGQLQSRIKTPLAYGEDLPDPLSLSRAIRDVPILRLDATTCGGISMALGIGEMAGHHGSCVLPHVFTSIHGQLAGACRAVDAVEFIPLEVGACPIYDLLIEKPDVRDGALHLSDRPGADQALNWDAVERAADKSTGFSYAA